MVERRTKIWLAKEMGRPGGDIFNHKVAKAWETVNGSEDMYAVRADGGSGTPSKTPTKRLKTTSKKNWSDEEGSIGKVTPQAKGKSKAKSKVATKAKAKANDAANGDDTSDVASDWSKVEDDDDDDAVDDDKGL